MSKYRVIIGVNSWDKRAEHLDFDTLESAKKKIDQIESNARNMGSFTRRIRHGNQITESMFTSENRTFSVLICFAVTRVYIQQIEDTRA